jgi:hypothetical protein
MAIAVTTVARRATPYVKLVMELQTTANLVLQATFFLMLFATTNVQLVATT